MSEHKKEHRKKVLIAEDDEDLREALFTVIAAEGFEVIAAADGEETLAKALKEHPDLTLLDLNMPRMSGQDVLKELSKDTWGKDAGVIVLTALSDMESVSSVLEQGGFEYLIKSDWKLEDIAARVRERLSDKA